MNKSLIQKKRTAQIEVKTALNRAPWGSCKKTKYNCITCSKEFERIKTKNNDPKYCSRKCIRHPETALRNKIDNPQHQYPKESKRTLVILNCQNCNKEVTRNANSAKNYKYCSKACFGQFQAKKNIKIWTCESCNCRFTRKSVGTDIPKYCTEACKYTYFNKKDPVIHLNESIQKIPGANLGLILAGVGSLISLLNLTAVSYLLFSTSKLKACERLCRSPRYESLQSISTYDIAAYKLGLPKHVVIEISKKKTVNYDHIKNIAFPVGHEQFELSKQFILDQVTVLK